MLKEVCIASNDAHERRPGRAGGKIGRRNSRWVAPALSGALCAALDFVSQGNTPAEAQHNLAEVIEIQFEEMTEIGTLDEYLAETICE
jgi:hypothetical protein